MVSLCRDELAVCVLLGDEAGDVSLLPQQLQVVGRQDEHVVEPLPEGEVPVGQVLLAEERPCQHQFVVVIRVPGKVVVSETERRKKSE